MNEMGEREAVMNHGLDSASLWRRNDTLSKHDGQSMLQLKVLIWEEDVKFIAEQVENLPHRGICRHG